MNKKQLAFLWIGIIVIVLMGLFPPWTVRYTSKPRHAFILTPILEANNYDETGGRFRWIQLNAYALFTQWFIVAVVSAGFIYCVKDKPKDKEMEGGEIMRIIAIILNLVFLGLVIHVLIVEGFPSEDALGLLYVSTVLACPIVNLIALAMSQPKKKIKALEKEGTE